MKHESDDENPTWTKEDFAKAKPAGQVLPTLVAAYRKTRGPGRKPAKIPTTVRLDPDVLEAFRAAGRGWQTRLNAALREWLQAHHT